MNEAKSRIDSFCFGKAVLRLYPHRIRRLARQEMQRYRRRIYL